MRYYKDPRIDFFMHHPKSDCLYAGLARKAIHHYLGDLYNPETFDPETELFIRRIIKSCVELKVFHKEPYDWAMIDNFLRKVIHDDGYTHVPYDLALIEKGYNGVSRGDLPKHSA